MLRKTLVVYLVVGAVMAGCDSKKDTDQTAQPGGADATTPAAQPSAPPVATTADSAATPSAASPAKGEEVYKNSCAACHASGVAGAPIFGNAKDWTPRIAQGKDVLYQHAITGFTGATGTMPAKGGNASLSDDDVKAAVDYMAANVKS